MPRMRLAPATQPLYILSYRVQPSKKNQGNSNAIPTFKNNTNNTTQENKVCNNINLTLAAAVILGTN